jgi:serpin B
MKTKNLMAIFAAVIIVIASAFSVYYFYQPSDDGSSTNVPAKLANEKDATADSVASLVESLNNFSFEFYDLIKQGKSDNVFISPYSIFVAVSMAYEGASENTYTEMKNVLNIPQNDSAIEASFGKIYNLLNQNQDGYEINTANAFWANEEYEFLDEYLNLLEDYYMAEANNLDFSKNVEAANTINAWVEEQTKGKIKDLIQSSSLSELTKLVLTNAIYFKGDWQTQFNKDDTYEEDFNLSSGDEVKVDMMKFTGEDARFNYTETQDLQILELPYSGNDLSMLILLPKVNDIDSINKSIINSDNLDTWRNSLSEQMIDIYIPKFEFETKYNLKDYLETMGIKDAFIPGVADFSGMDGTLNLFINEVVHKAYVKVDEEGTEAAAATGVVMGITSINPGDVEEFKADHPFIFLIQHKETGAVLFMGTVLDPTE